MELKKYIDVLRKRLWLIILIPLITTSIGYSINKYYIKPAYSTSATLYVGINSYNQSNKIQYSDILLYAQLTKTYSELIKSRMVCNETISRLKYKVSVGQLQSMLNVTTKVDSQILEVSIQDTNPDRAADLVNTLSQVFIECVKKLTNSDDIKILDEAIVPRYPFKPNVRINTATAFLIGLMASLVIIFIIEWLDSTMKSEDDIVKYLGVTVLANIPYVKEKKK